MMDLLSTTDPAFVSYLLAERRALLGRLGTIEEILITRGALRERTRAPRHDERAPRRRSEEERYRHE